MALSALGQPVAADWLETGAFACDNLVCVKSPVPASGWTKPNPYCSKACVSDRDCYRSETGLVCRQVVLDPDFLAELGNNDTCGVPPGDCRSWYLGQIAFSSYCAIPLP
jgi:hypothetical protein